MFAPLSASVGVLFVTLSAAPARPPCEPQLALLGSGTYTGDSDVPFWPKEQIEAWGGGGWLGWTYRSSALQPLTLTLHPGPKDSGYDESLTVTSTAKVDYAVRCISTLRPGAIHDAGVVNHSLTFRGPLDVTLGATKYSVRLDSRDPGFADANVILGDGRRTQVLFSAGGFADDPMFEVEWAGDLDRDGKLDLVTTLTRKYSEHPHVLWLSSKARPGELVGRAAVYIDGD